MSFSTSFFYKGNILIQQQRYNTPPIKKGRKLQTPFSDKQRCKELQENILENLMQQYIKRIVYYN